MLLMVSLWARWPYTFATGAAIEPVFSCFAGFVLQVPGCRAPYTRRDDRPHLHLLKRERVVGLGVITGVGDHHAPLGHAGSDGTCPLWNCTPA
jgi:hypothetical protein